MGRILLEILLAAGASLGFEIVFNVNKKDLAIGAITGGISWGIFLVATRVLQFNLIFSLFIASTMMSLFSEVMARKVKSPATSFIVCGMIPLVPGGAMYYTMYESVKGNTSESLQKGLNTISQALTIAIGIVFVYSIFRLIKIRKMKKLMKK